MVRFERHQDERHEWIQSGNQFLLILGFQHYLLVLQGFLEALETKCRKNSATNLYGLLLGQKLVAFRPKHLDLKVHHFKLVVILSGGISVGPGSVIPLFLFVVDLDFRGHFHAPFDNRVEENQQLSAIDTFVLHECATYSSQDVLALLDFRNGWRFVQDFDYGRKYIQEGFLEVNMLSVYFENCLCFSRLGLFDKMKLVALVVRFLSI